VSGVQAVYLVGTKSFCLSQKDPEDKDDWMQDDWRLKIMGATA